MVDLDGAKEKRPVNLSLFKEMIAQSGLKVEAGGGIRDMKTIEEYVNAGVARVILGSAAVKDPQLVRESVKEFQAFQGLILVL